MDREVVMYIRLSLLVVMALVVAGCGVTYDVTTTMESGEYTRDIWVWAPEGEGGWPVVVAFPGSGGDARSTYDVLGSELARKGVLVMATDALTFDELFGRLDEMQQILECGYRYSLSVAEEYGGDLTQPVTMLGFSMGATGAFLAGLNDSAYGPGGIYEKCLPAVPRPDVVVSIAGCHRTLTGIEDGLPSESGAPMEFDPRWEWDHREAHVLLIAGREDDNCRPSQSEQAAVVLRSNGFDVRYVEIVDAKHGDMVFHDISNDWATLPPSHPPGQITVKAVLQAIKDAE